MVDLMLQAPAKQTIAFDLPQLALKIEITNANPRLTGDGNGNSGNREATLAIGDGLTFDFYDLRIEKNDGIARFFIPVAIDDDNALKHTNLRSGKADAVVLVHDVGHLLRKTLKGLVLFRVARLANLIEQRIRRLHDLDHANIPSIVENIPNLSNIAR